MKCVLQFLVTFLLFYNIKCNPCSESEAVILDDGVKFDNGSIIFDNTEFTSDEWFVSNTDNVTVIFGCPCLRRTCVRKCCVANSMFVNNTCAETGDGSSEVFNPPVYDNKELLDLEAKSLFFFIYGQSCEKAYLLDPEFGEYSYLQQDGRLYEVSDSEAFHPSSEYCMDMYRDNTSTRLVALVCFPQTSTEESSEFHIAYAVGILLSVPFLLITLLVYAFVPELRNLHGLCLMAYCAGLIVAYICLASLKLNPTLLLSNRTACFSLSLTVYYSFLTSFFWVNVMCYDIWRTFSSFHNSSVSRKRELKRFAYYGIYAWGIPLILTILTIVFQFADSLPEGILRPGLGQGQCWFPSWQKELAYFYAPIIIIQICNCILFAITANKIRSVRQQTAILRGSESARSDRINIDKQRYALYLKLFIVMGVNWSVELLSWALGGPSWYWILTDLLNIGLGFFIFIIFVWKNKIRNMLIKRVHSVRRSHISGTDSSGGRWATGTSSAPTEDTRVSHDDQAIRLNSYR